jgi:hypothetical protein
MPNGKAQTREVVSLGQTYTAPQNSQVQVKFTKLPDAPGVLTIQQITLTADQQAAVGALSDVAYDISSTMADGSFRYDLTLPKPAGAEDVTVKYAENLNELDSAQAVTQPTQEDSDSIHISGLDHFTIFVSADTTGGAYTAVANPTISESAVGQITTGTIVLTAPSGFAFDPTSTVTATVTPASCPANKMLQLNGGLSVQTATPTSTTITFNVATQSAGNAACASTITVSGVTVRPINGTPLASLGSVTRGGTSTGGTFANGDSVQETVGAISASGSTVSASPASVAADSTATSTITVTLKDQFGNAVVGGSDAISLVQQSGPAGVVITTSPSASVGGVAAFTVKAPNTAVGTAVFAATDTTAGVAITQTASVTFTDVDAPVIASHGTVTAEAASAAGATVSYAAPATSDNHDAAAVASCSPVSGTVFPIGTTPVYCDATDAQGNHAIQTSFNVVVSDSTAPLISTPTIPAAEATSASGAVVTYAAPTATDAVDGTDAVTCDKNSGDIFSLGTTTVHCSATDSHANTVDATFAVEVVDTTAPNITVPADIGGVESTSVAGATVTYTAPSAADIVDGTDAVTCDAHSGQTFPLGTTIVHCSSSDAAGNSSSATFQVTVVDTTAPTTVSSGIDSDWHNSDVQVTLTCSDVLGSGCASTLYTTDGSDPLTSATVQTYSSPFTLTATGTYQIKYYSRDNAGNSEAVQDGGTVKIDKVLPSIPVLGAIISPTNNALVAWTWSAASDANAGVKLYAWRITDAASNLLDSGTTTALNYSRSLADGVWNFFVRSVDNAGNESADASSQVLVDTVAPATPVIPLTDAQPGDYFTDLALHLESSDANSFTIYYTLDGTTPSSSSTAYTGSAITVDHTLTLKAVAVDTAGNVSGVLTADYAIAPIISEQSIGNATTTTPGTEQVIAWDTDDASTSRVVYGQVSVPALGSAPNYGYDFSTATFDTAPNKVQHHVVTLTGLQPDKTYYYRVISAGSPANVSDQHSFQTGTSQESSYTGGGGHGSEEATSTSTSSNTNPATGGKVLGAQTISSAAQPIASGISLASLTGGAAVAVSGHAQSGEVAGATTASPSPSPAPSPSPSPEVSASPSPDVQASAPASSHAWWYVLAIVIIAGVGYYIWRRRGATM